ncbi:hypothetical protein DY926_15225 [Komagataeibacter melaceti]|uniref:DUF1376 domain-containing protein n=1 Tax=Komagataeibacter melaceti TaxID=2766577 RepID=A0A371YWV7_9PROT|nr:hypothetical protein [Komagataeibacter melaceti]RFD18726.1 hypothetical protein DY926_15225 [Komagataeibacter melaceti]
MARIRSIHPGIYTDEGFATLSMAARVLLIGIWNHADDGGGFEWKPLTLKMRIFPADAVDVSALLDELAGADAITRYEHDGRSYGAVRNFGKWQKPKKPSRFCPMPEQVRKYAHTTHIKTDDEAKVSSEQDKVETEDKVPSVPPKDATGSEPVPNQSGKSISEGRKGGREEGNISPSLRSGSSSSPSAEAKGPRSAEFDEFWEAYPRKVDKGAAMKAHTKARTKTPQAEIMLGLARHVAVWPERKSDFGFDLVPYPASWLNAMGWAGDPEASAAARKHANPHRIPQRNQGRPAIWDAIPDCPGV